MLEFHLLQRKEKQHNQLQRKTTFNKRILKKKKKKRKQQPTLNTTHKNFKSCPLFLIYRNNISISENYSDFCTSSSRNLPVPSCVLVNILGCKFELKNQSKDKEQVLLFILKSTLLFPLSPDIFLMSCSSLYHAILWFLNIFFFFYLL